MNSTDRPASRRIAGAAVKNVLLVFPLAAVTASAVAAGSLGAIGPTWRWWMVLTLSVAGLAAASTLALQQLGRIKAPGCGEAGGCVQLTGSRWGKIFGWPVSFLGTAWFASLVAFQLAGWAGRVPGLLLTAFSAGALGSLFFLSLILCYRHVCPYCLMVHSANLAAWLLLATAPQPTWSTPQNILGAAIAAGVFVATTLTLAWARARTKKASAQRRERQLQRSLRRIRRHLHRARKQHLRPQVLGRWWRGPQNAAVRLVVFSDYECPDCRRTELQLERYLVDRCNVAVTYKHFPLSRQCNRRVKSASEHRHACRAARVAEAAGVLAGSRGFLPVHSWLFHCKAVFTDQELANALPTLGFADPQAFFDAMSGPEVAKHLEEDIEEGIRLGLAGTPAVFVEGLRLEGVTNERAIPRLLESLEREAGGRRDRAGNANGR